MIFDEIPNVGPLLGNSSYFKINVGDMFRKLYLKELLTYTKDNQIVILALVD
jgi:hypothetical protein